MKDYFDDVKKEYSLIKQIKLSVVISFSLLVLDVLDILSKIIPKYGIYIVLLITIGSFILVGLTIIEKGILDMFKMPFINSIDVMICVLLFSILIYALLIYLMGGIYLYKKKILIFLLLILFFIFGIRIYKYTVSKKISVEYISNIIDLKDLYEGEIKKNENRSILLEEKDVDYDLLDRKKIINYLYDSIISTNPQRKFVISLEGKWGSGKTTIIKNVKKMIKENNKDIILIDEFNPWIYGDENALLLNMFNLILQKSGFKYNYLFTENMAKDLSELILGVNKSSLIKSIFFQNRAINMKSRINKYLKLSGKKVVFFIDNIDRAEKENVILLFKLVGSILDFDRITYILSFDDNRIKNIFKKDLSIDYEYLKKIINLQIRVPEIDKTILINLYGTSLKKILVMCGENNENLNNYDSFIEFISNEGLDLRDFKRFINSAVNRSFKTKNYLNKKDLLILEYIKMFNFPLYKVIFDNRKYFISQDIIYDNQLYKVIFEKEKFNIEGRDFFLNLFKDQYNKRYEEILGEIFPYVNKYINGEDLEYTGNIIMRNPNYKTISKLRGISSAKYFDLYFTETGNVHTKVGEIVENLIDEINKKQSFENKQRLFQNKLNIIHYSYHKDIFDRIQLYLDDIKQDSIYDFISLLFNNVKIIDNSIENIIFNARSKLAISIHVLLNKISDNEYVNFLESVRREYGKLSFLKYLLYWFNNDVEDINIKGRKELLEEVINEMVAEILNNNINLYEDIFYLEKNIWGLYDMSEDKKDSIKNYIESIISEKNIFRFLNDIINVSFSGERYKYFIKKEDLEIFTSKADIDLILERVEPKTSNEEFILKVYDEYVNNICKESGIVLVQEKKLVL